MPAKMVGQEQAGTDAPAFAEFGATDATHPIGNLSEHERTAHRCAMDRATRQAEHQQPKHKAKSRRLRRNRGAAPGGEMTGELTGQIVHGAKLKRSYCTPR
jgi:hypothetical protein